VKRLSISERPNWQQTVESQGFLFHSTDTPYWNESACYEFRETEILAIERATNELFELCMEAVQHVIDRKRYAEFHIPAEYGELIEFSWDNDLPSLYGRFDLAYDGQQIKMLEFNADTPTSLLEASVIQWFWLQDYDKHKDQFNSIHDRLLAHLREIKPYMLSPELHFSCVRDSTEDYMTVAYLMDCAQQAGYHPNFLYVDEIGYNDASQQFQGVQNEHIRNIFKLYPYEWMIHEEFGPKLIADREKTYWIEPAWKMILSNKMILRVLWELFPYHPHLLETSLAPLAGDYVRKPKLSREGANVTLMKSGRVLAETGGDYGEEGYVYQRYFPIPAFDGRTPVLGSWVIGGEAAGMGIREAGGPITDNLSRFVPHFFV
jgi:glutathionylspermidine synthase